MNERYIGIFDILGFKDLIESNSLEAVVERSRRFVTLANGALSIPDCGDGPDRLSVRVFQDTVIVTSRTTKPDDFECMAQYCCGLMGFAFLEDVLLRGALTFGEAYLDDQMVIGKGIVRAYQMEQLQDWVGCWIDEKCVDGLPQELRDELQEYLLVRYRVPLKSGPMLEAWALNWTYSIAHLKGNPFDPAWRRVWKRACDGPISWEARRKLEQTDRFLGGLISRKLRGWQRESPAST
jgi:hypothetical protein